MFLALTPVLSMFLTNVFFKQQHKFLWYLYAFLAGISVSLLCNSSLFANEGPFQPPQSLFDTQYGMSYRNARGVTLKVLSQSDRDYYSYLRDYHLNEALYQFGKMQIYIDAIENFDDKALTQACLGAGAILCGPGDSYSKLMIAGLHLLSQITYHCYVDWHEFKMYYNNASYYFEMYEFYRDIIKNDDFEIELEEISGFS